MQLHSPPGENATTSELISFLKSEKELKLPENHPNKRELHELAQLCVRYADVFGSSNDELGQFYRPVRIPTNGQSARRKQHQIPANFRDSVDLEVSKMLDSRVIEICDDPRGFNSPLFVVPKKDNSARVVANFKGTLNRVLTDPDPFHAPNLRELFDEMRPGNRYLASLDLKSGYWQVEIDPLDRHKTAFSWGGRCYMYRRLPFGLATAGNIFSRCVHEALESLPDLKGVFIYIDDVMIALPNFSDYLAKLSAIFDAARKFGLRFHPAKCDLLAPEVKFLGRIVSPKGMSVDPEYVTGVDAFVPPTSRSELRTLLGRLTWIREFMCTRLHERIDMTCFSQLVFQLNQLNKEGTFAWTAKAQEAFDRVKTRLRTSPVISFADPALDFLLVTDASLVAEGAVLMQLQDGREKIVGVASRTFNSVEQRWSATEREAHALLFGIRRFQYFLRGKPFVVKTDHQALCYIDSVDHKNAKLARWMDELSAYRFVVQYLPGEQNVWADMYSRPFGLKKNEPTGTLKPAGKFVEFSGSLKAYIPSWCTKATVAEPTEPSPKMLTEGIARALVCSTAGEFIFSDTAFLKASEGKLCRSHSRSSKFAELTTISLTQALAESNKLSAAIAGPT